MSTTHAIFGNSYRCDNQVTNKTNSPTIDRHLSKSENNNTTPSFPVPEIDAAIAPMLGADADTPIGITIRVTESSGKRIAGDLILDAAVDCPAYFRRAEEETPTRTVAHLDKPPGGIIN